MAVESQVAGVAPRKAPPQGHGLGSCLVPSAHVSAISANGKQRELIENLPTYVKIHDQMLSAEQEDVSCLQIVGELLKRLCFLTALLTLRDTVNESAEHVELCPMDVGRIVIQEVRIGLVSA